MTARRVDPAAFYGALADHYDEQYVVPHRRAYDDLAWEAVVAALPTAAGRVVDVGCGTGRWAQRFAAMGHRVIGIEPSERMANAARRKAIAGLELQTASVDDALVEEKSANVVVAMGSLQYAPDPLASVSRIASWLRPGGSLFVLCDSLMGLVLELLRAGRQSEALARLAARQGEWSLEGRAVAYRLLTAGELSTAFLDAGLCDVQVHGLLVGWSALGRDGVAIELGRDPEGHVELERRLASSPAMADAGKQLLAVGRRSPEEIGQP